jgi:hypothetical protein
VQDVDLRTRAQAALGQAQEIFSMIAASDLALRVAEQRAESIRLRDVARQLREERGASRNLFEELQHEVAGLKKAMESRATIEQAKGILMAAEHCTPDEAFDMLTRASQRQNRKLALIAADIVERTTQRREPAEGRGKRAASAG